MNSKTQFKKGLKQIIKAYYAGNNFWFTAEEYGHDKDQNFYCCFIWNDRRYYLIEEIGYTQCGALFSQLNIFDAFNHQLVYLDSFHDGNGAWQTSNAQEAATDYSELTEYILYLLKPYDQSASIKDEKNWSIENNSSYIIQNGTFHIQSVLFKGKCIFHWSDNNGLNWDVDDADVMALIAPQWVKDMFDSFQNRQHNWVNSDEVYARGF